MGDYAKMRQSIAMTAMTNRAMIARPVYAKYFSNAFISNPPQDTLVFLLTQLSNYIIHFYKSQ